MTNQSDSNQERTRNYYADSRSRSYHLRLKQHTAEIAGQIADSHGVSKSVVADIALSKADPTWLSNLVANAVGGGL